MKYIFANWKMYLDSDEASLLVGKLKSINFNKNKLSIAVFPNTISFIKTLELKEVGVSVGAQNVAWTPKGAYTGATSADIFASAGATYALVGHSERRHIFGETNEDVRNKLEACIDAGIIPVLCIGESEEDLADDKREYRLKKQLMKALAGLKIEEGKMMIAYEPVWAIGSGKPCSPEEADLVHKLIKSELVNYTDTKVPLLYGGSANESNVVSYLSYDDIDGVLSGGASTNFESFASIIKNAEEI